MVSTSNHSARNGALTGIAAIFAAILGVVSFSGIASAGYGYLSQCHDHYDLIAFVLILVLLAVVLGIAYLGHINKDQ